MCSIESIILPNISMILLFDQVFYINTIDDNDNVKDEDEYGLSEYLVIMDIVS